MLSMRISFVYPQHAHKELMCALSMCVRNWAYTSGNSACTEHTCQELMRAQSRVLLKHAEHTHQKLMHTQSIWARNWCIPWAYASVSFTYAHRKRKNSKFKKVPSKHAEYAC
jgi:hypothetical protein